MFVSLQIPAWATFCSATKFSCPPASCVPHYSTNILWWSIIIHSDDCADDNVGNCVRPLLLLLLPPLIMMTASTVYTQRAFNLNTIKSCSAETLCFLVCKALYVVPFNRHCTYQAELSEGSDQEKASYILTTKQKLVKLIGQWVALYGLLLKEDPIASDFLEVRFQARLSRTVTAVLEYFHIYGGESMIMFPLLFPMLLRQRLKKEVAGDFRLSSMLKEQFRERRRAKV